MREVRGSKAHVNFSCPASVVSPTIQIRIAGDEPARTGSAVHEALASHTDGVRPDVTEICRRWDVDEEGDFAFLLGSGKRCWEMVKAWFPGHQTEQYHSHLFHFGDASILVTGHIDVESVVDGEFRALDWKTGRLDDDHDTQIKLYSLLGMEKHLLDRARAFVVRVRDQVVDPFEWTKDELLRWLEGEASKLNNTDDYRPGRHCTYCPRSHECAAKESLLRQGIEILDQDGRSLPLEPAQRGPRLALMLDRLKALETFCENTRKAIRADVAAYGGELPAGEGRFLQLNEEQRETIIYEECEDILQEALGGGLKKILKVSKSGILDAVRAAAGAGMKSSAAAEMMDRLRDAGAVQTKVIEKLEFRRAPKQLKGNK